MRIIAGRLKGRRLTRPGGDGIRPTADSLRETLFNVLGSDIGGMRVLDAFAGTGAVGLEALSRGAAHVTFIERDPDAGRLLDDNVRVCGAGEACAIIRDDFLAPRGRLAGPPPWARGGFDLVFLDPPYECADLGAVVDAAAPCVAATGRLVLEHSRRRESPETAGALRRTRVLVAGDSALSFYARPEGPDVEARPVR